MAPPAPVSHPIAPTTPIVTRRLADGTTVTLARDAVGDGRVGVTPPGRGSSTPVDCGRLEGAWGLWNADVDGDGREEILVALRKRARFDPAIENRLHVYALADGRCVPLWRGTRLAGRFDALAIEPSDDGDRLIVLERVGPTGRRVARYRWVDFGFAVERVLWAGQGEPPEPWRTQWLARGESQ